MTSPAPLDPPPTNPVHSPCCHHRRASFLQCHLSEPTDVACHLAMARLAGMKATMIVSRDTSQSGRGLIAAGPRGTAPCPEALPRQMPF